MKLIALLAKFLNPNHHEDNPSNLTHGGDPLINDTGIEIHFNQLFTPDRPSTKALCDRLKYKSSFPRPKSAISTNPIFYSGPFCRK